MKKSPKKKQVEYHEGTSVSYDILYQEIIIIKNRLNSIEQRFFNDRKVIYDQSQNRKS